MAALSASVQAFLDAPLGVKSELKEAALRTIVARVRDGTATLQEVVQALGPSLTSTTDHVLTSGSLLLGEVLCACQGIVSDAGSLHHYVEFLTGRLNLRPCLEGTLLGLRGLVSRSRNPEWCQLDEADVKMIATKVLTQVHLPSVAFGPRMAGFDLLVALIRGHGAALIRAGLDIFDAVITQVDRQKDPRCLLLATEVVEALRGLPNDVQPEVNSDTVQEMHEVLSIYFPVNFVPLPGQDLTREELVTAVENALTALPGFRDHLVPWLLQKISSRKDPADCLRLLARCVERFGCGPEGMGGHADALWAAFRYEILGAGFEGRSVSEAEDNACTATAAALALSRCIRAGMVIYLDRALSEDVLGADLVAMLGRAGHWEYESAVKIQRAKASAGVMLYALCSASPAAAERALAAVTPKLKGVISSWAGQLPERPRPALEGIQWAIELVDDCLKGMAAEGMKLQPIAVAAVASAVMAATPDTALGLCGPRAISAVIAIVRLVKSMVLLAAGADTAVSFQALQDSAVVLSSMCQLGLAPTPAQASRLPEDVIDGLKEEARALMHEVGACFALIDRDDIAGGSAICREALQAASSGMQYPFEPYLSSDKSWPGPFAMWASVLRDVARGGGGTASASLTTMGEAFASLCKSTSAEAHAAAVHLGEALRGALQDFGAKLALGLQDEAPESVARGLLSSPASSQGKDGSPPDLLRTIGRVSFEAALLVSRGSRKTLLRAAKNVLDDPLNYLSQARFCAACGILAGTAAFEDEQGLDKLLMDALGTSSVADDAILFSVAAQALAAVAARIGDEGIPNSLAVRAKDERRPRAAHVLGFVCAALSVRGYEGGGMARHHLVQMASRGTFAMQMEALEGLRLAFSAEAGALRVGASIPAGFLWESRMVGGMVNELASTSRGEGAQAAAGRAALFALGACRQSHVESEAKRAAPLLLQGIASLLAGDIKTDEWWQAETLDNELNAKGGVARVLSRGVELLDALLKDAAFFNALVEGQAISLEHIVVVLVESAKFTRWHVRHRAYVALASLAKGGHELQRWHLMSGFKAAVLKQVKTGLDDPARAVRGAAITAAEAWS